MRAVFVCQAVDRDDPILATTIRWIEALARQPAVYRVTVLALRTGRHELPAAVDVRRFGRSNRLGTLFGFYGEVARSLRDRPDFFFIYQGGPYPLLLLAHETAPPDRGRAMEGPPRDQPCDGLLRPILR